MKNTPKYFLTRAKQHGALLAKVRLVGIQFDTLFTDNLYFDISRHAIEMAEKLKEVFVKENLVFLIDSPTNQLFVIMENAMMKRLEEKVRLNYWESYGADCTVLRFATDWATRPEDIDAFAEVLHAVTNKAATE